MRLRLEGMLRELLIYGEVFNRYFRTRPGLVVRQLDPATIWDVYTDQDDIETVHFYHQQYVILNTLNIPGGVKGAPPSTLIIRQIPGDEIDHFKINSTSSEKRGRSQLFAVLGYFQRFREFANDRVLLNKMRAMFALDVSVEGGPEDLAAAESQFTTPPGTGSVLVHNSAVSVEFKNANNNANEAKTDGELLLKIIAIGAGVSEQLLGVTDGTSRAGALIQTEPDVKNFESYQELVEEVLTRASVRVFKAAGLTSPGQAMEFTFPAIAQEDRSSKLKDVAFAEAMDYFTKERSAAMVAREFQITTYDYGKERAAIQKERQEHPVIATGLQQVKVPMALRPHPAADGHVTEQRHGGGVVRVTTLERTLVDVLDAPANAGGWEEVWRSLEMVEFFDLDAVVSYTLRLGSALTVGRVGFFLEQHRDALMVEDAHLDRLCQHRPRQPRYLDAERKPGTLVASWNLIVPASVLGRTWGEVS